MGKIIILYKTKHFKNNIKRRRRENSGNNLQTIEIGSGHFDRVTHAVDFGSHCNGEATVVKQKLQEAMDDDVDFEENTRRLCMFII